MASFAHAVAHFLDKLLFCMSAEDAGLLPGDLIERLARAGRDDPGVFASGALSSKCLAQGAGLNCEGDRFVRAAVEHAGDLPLAAETANLARMRGFSGVDV